MLAFNPTTSWKLLMPSRRWEMNFKRNWKRNLNMNWLMARLATHWNWLRFVALVRGSFHATFIFIDYEAFIFKVVMPLLRYLHNSKRVFCQLAVDRLLWISLNQLYSHFYVTRKKPRILELKRFAEYQYSPSNKISNTDVSAETASFLNKCVYIWIFFLCLVLRQILFGIHFLHDTLFPEMSVINKKGRSVRVVFRLHDTLFPEMSVMNIRERSVKVVSCCLPLQKGCQQRRESPLPSFRFMP